jgi:hypothetical protein
MPAPLPRTLELDLPTVRTLSTAERWLGMLCAATGSADTTSEADARARSRTSYGPTRVLGGVHCRSSAAAGKAAGITIGHLAGQRFFRRTTGRTN